MKVQRLRIRFSKTRAMQYTGHLDVRRAWERTMRRAGLPLAYSQGYTPHPRLNLASPLPLGFTSTAELADVWLSEKRDPEFVQTRLAEAVPPGFEIHSVEEIPDLHGDKLPTLIKSSLYLLTFHRDAPDLPQRVEDLMSREHIHRQRKKKTYDLRPLIEDMKILSPSNQGTPRLQVQVSSRPGANGRPDEVLRALGYSPYSADICRTQIVLAEPDKES